MAWTNPSDHAATIVSQAEWNAFHGASGNCKYLKDAVDAPMKAQGDGGTVYGGRAKLNFISGANVVATVADDAGNSRINITLAAGGASIPTQSANSGVLAVTTSATQGAKGSYVQAFASTPFAIIGILFAATYVSAEAYTWDIAAGGAGSEVVKVADIFNIAGTPHYYFPFSIPSAGVRLAVRGANLSSANARALSVVMTIFG